MMGECDLANLPGIFVCFWPPLPNRNVHFAVSFGAEPSTSHWHEADVTLGRMFALEG